MYAHNKKSLLRYTSIHAVQNYVFTVNFRDCNGHLIYKLILKTVGT